MMHLWAVGVSAKPVKLTLKLYAVQTAHGADEETQRQPSRYSKDRPDPSARTQVPRISSQSLFKWIVESSKRRTGDFHDAPHIIKLQRNRRGSVAWMFVKTALGI
jgi:hypothetical protein